MTIKKAAVWAALAAVTLTPTIALAQEPPRGPNHITGLSADPGFTGTVTEFSGTANPQSTSVIGALRTVVNAFLALVALIAVIVIILAGFRYVTSGGDEEASTAAKNQIIFALIGLVIILLSAVIVNFIIGLFPAGGTS